MLIVSVPWLLSMEYELMAVSYGYQKLIIVIAIALETEVSIILKLKETG